MMIFTFKNDKIESITVEGTTLRIGDLVVVTYHSRLVTVGVLTGIHPLQTGDVTLSVFVRHLNRRRGGVIRSYLPSRGTAVARRTRRLRKFKWYENVQKLLFELRLKC